MMASGWWFWSALMILVLMPAVGYGWGYRKWGPPYPRYVQERRHAEQVMVAAGAPAAFDHKQWGLAGDLVWIVLVAAMLCSLSAFWWH